MDKVSAHYTIPLQSPLLSHTHSLVLLSELLISANTSRPQHHRTILQHSNEKGIYPSATSVALPFASSMYHFLCLWHIKMPFGYPLTTWFHIPYHIQLGRGVG